MIVSPFNTFEAKKVHSKFEKEYVSYLVVEKVKEGFDPKKPHEFIIEKEVIEDERVPIFEAVNAHRSRVGLKNLLKGIVSQKQMQDFISKTGSSGLFVDGTKLPSSDLEMEKLVGSIDRIYNSIPEELRGKLTKEEFISSINLDKLNDYFAKLESQGKEENK